MTVTRYETSPVYSKVTEANGFLFTAGVIPTDLSKDVEGQTAEVLAEIDRLLALAGTSKAKIVQEGSDVTIVAYSSTVVTATQAAATLTEEGVSVELIDLRTVSPWDRETVLASVRKTGRAVIVHEAVRSHGVGAEIAATIQEEAWGSLKAPVRRLGAPYSPVPFAKVLENAFLVQADEVVTAVKSVLG